MVCVHRGVSIIFPYKMTKAWKHSDTLAHRLKGALIVDLQAMQVSAIGYVFKAIGFWQIMNKSIKANK
jgi:hypothetical protein